MKTIIFDFDGVLIDSYNFSFNTVKEVDCDISEEDFKAHHDGNVLDNPKVLTTNEKKVYWNNKYFKNVNNLNQFFSLDEIKFLNSKFELFIISSNEEDIIKKFLSYKELDYFGEVLGAKFNNSKIVKFNYLFNKYDLKVDDCVFISDTLGDILEGHKVGIKTIAVDFGYHNKKRLEKGEPFKIVSNFDELLEILKIM